MRKIWAGHHTCLEAGFDVSGGRLLSLDSVCKRDPWCEDRLVRGIWRQDEHREDWDNG